MTFEKLYTAIPCDAKTMAMPHPLRVTAAGGDLVDALRQLLRPAKWAELVSTFKDDSLMTADAMASLVERPGFEPLSYLAQESTQRPGGSEMGNLYTTMLGARNSIAPQPFFRIDDKLCEMLANTDLDDELPLDVLKVPYPRFYVEFGEKRNLEIFIPNELSGMHALEGAYVEEGNREGIGRGLYVMLTGSPIGKRNALDDATHALFMPLAKALSLNQALRWSFAQGNENAIKHGLITAGEEALGPALECLNFLAKVLLYIGLPEARRSVHPERTQWLKSISNLKSSAKLAKAQRKGKRLVDYILITAPIAQPSAEADVSKETRKGVKVHWRRGHYRLQAHGPQNSQRKLLFIRPLLVNAAQGLSAAEAPNYKVV